VGKVVLSRIKNFPNAVSMAYGYDAANERRQRRRSER
jgi:hypothetical protein